VKSVLALAADEGVELAGRERKGLLPHDTISSSLSVRLLKLEATQHIGSGFVVTDISLRLRFAIHR